MKLCFLLSESFKKSNTSNILVSMKLFGIKPQATSTSPVSFRYISLKSRCKEFIFSILSLSNSVLKDDAIMTLDKCL